MAARNRRGRFVRSGLKNRANHLNTLVVIECEDIPNEEPDVPMEVEGTETSTDRIDDEMIEEAQASTQEESTWKDGRRIVEIGYLAEQLEHCANCEKSLHLVDCNDERIYGLGSILYVQCRHCPHVNKLYTGKRHRAPGKTRGMQIWDVNTKCGLGMCYLNLFERPTVSVSSNL